MRKIFVGASVSAVMAVCLLSFGGMSAANAASVMKECGDEWKAAKAAGTTNGQTWRDFLASCRAKKEGGAAPAPVATTAPAPAPAPSMTPTPVSTPAPKAAPAKPKFTPTAAASGAGEFNNENEAKAKCPTDMIVWVNLGGKTPHKYHAAGSKWYGSTKKGAYMCQADANAAGDVAAKNEKPK